LLLARREPRLSLCMIVRDNARTIRACLESVRPWVDEMVVVDTGSRDETPRVAGELGARVFHFPWRDDFSAARNESLRHARGAWVFWMDSDDTIDADCGRGLRELASGEHPPAVLGYVIRVRCPGPGADGRADVTVVDHVKLFRNLPQLRFEGRIHEQILPAIRRAGGEVAWTGLFVVHSGYDHSPEGQRRKLDRDLRLLGLELRERPGHPFTLFNLGMTLADAGRHVEAVARLRDSVARSGAGESHLRKAFALLVSSLHKLGRWEDALGACERGLGLFPLDAELRFRRGMLLHERGRLEEAAGAYRDLLERPEGRHFTSVVDGLGGHLARHNLALVYADAGDWEGAEGQWRAAVAGRPSYARGWEGLGEVLVRRGKLGEAAALAARQLAEPGLRREGLLLRGKVALAGGDRAGARGEWERAAAEYPADPAPRQLLGQLYFEDGDLAAAERALTELERLDPEDAAAGHNLGAVYARQGRAAEAIDAYRRSLRRRPGSAPTHVLLGNALHEAGRDEEAARAWEKALELEPGHPGAREGLRRVRGLSVPDQACGTGGAAEGSWVTHSLVLGGRAVALSAQARGPVDRAILGDVWARDVYRVRDAPGACHTILDVGAHVGAFTLLAAETWPGARVIACEPDAENFRLLEEHVRGRPGVEAVRAAVVGDDVVEVDFHMVADKAGQNSGGGSCRRPEAGSVRVRVPAVSVVRLWQEKGLTSCDLLKLDCEMAELPVLRALAAAGLLARVGRVVGEWHADRGGAEAVGGVKAELGAVLAATHEVVFFPDGGGREGHFRATLRPGESAGARSRPEPGVPATPDAPTTAPA
jgi:FkbM family methyltransferase